jgi:hypothetical protein
MCIEGISARRWIVTLGAVALGLAACSKSTWMPEEKKPIYKAEITNLPEQEAMHFKNRTRSLEQCGFTLNKEYIFSATEIHEGEFEFMIPYHAFLQKVTASLSLHEEVWRIWIEGDEASGTRVNSARTMSRVDLQIW